MMSVIAITRRAPPPPSNPTKLFLTGMQAVTVIVSLCLKTCVAPIVKVCQYIRHTNAN